MMLYQFCRISEYTLDNLQNSQIYYAGVNQVNDPFEGLFRFNVADELKVGFVKCLEGKYSDIKYNSSKIVDEQIKRIFQNADNYFISNVGVCCFTENIQSIIMWGHYGDGHKGLCLEFDFDYDSNVMRRVRYQNHIETIEVNREYQLNSDYLNDLVKSVRYIKHKDWHYEQEVRMFQPKGTKESYHPTRLTSVYFGCRMDPKDKLEILKILKDKKYSHVKAYEAEVNMGEYRMNYTLIDQGSSSV